MVVIVNFILAVTQDAHLIQAEELYIVGLITAINDI
jgi:hypothetical protein